MLNRVQIDENDDDETRGHVWDCAANWSSPGNICTTYDRQTQTHTHISTYRDIIVCLIFGRRTCWYCYETIIFYYYYHYTYKYSLQNIYKNCHNFFIYTQAANCLLLFNYNFILRPFLLFVFVLFPFCLFHFSRVDFFSISINYYWFIVYWSKIIFYYKCAIISILSDNNTLCHCFCL